MSREQDVINFQEIGSKLYDLKSVLANALDVISQSCYKDQRGDYNYPTSQKEIEHINVAISVLSKQITQYQRT